MPIRPPLLDRFRARLGVLYRELLKFGVVGAIAFVIDLGGTNLLWHTVFEDKVTTARIVAGVVATLFAWVGNRSWTFRHRRSRKTGQEVTLFFVVNGLALAISAGVLAFSHYGLGFQTRLADNIAMIVGVAIGTVFRFVTYRLFVFNGSIDIPDAAAAAVSRQAQQR